jgi:hypothetical protein
MGKKSGDLVIPCMCSKISPTVHKECLWEKRKEYRNAKKMFACSKCNTEYPDTAFFLELHQEEAFRHAKKKLTSIFFFMFLFFGTAFIGGFQMIRLYFPTIGIALRLALATLPLFVIHGCTYFAFLTITRIGDIYKHIILLFPITLIAAAIMESFKINYYIIALVPISLFTAVGLYKFVTDSAKYIKKEKERKMWKMLKKKYVETYCQSP